MSGNDYQKQLQGGVNKLQTLLGRWESDPVRREQTAMVMILKDSAQTLGRLADSLETRRNPLQFFKSIMDKGGPLEDITPQNPLVEIDLVLTDMVNRLKDRKNSLPDSMAEELRTSLHGVAEAARNLSEHLSRR